MYESEVNRVLEPAATLPPAIRERFAELRAQVTARTLLPWGEHCTECAWPTCYTTCELYTPRADGNCRLFVDGMVRVDVPDALSPYLLKLRFKRWGKLWTVGSLAMHDPQEAARREKANMMIGAVARSAPLPRPLKTKVLAKVAYRRRVDTETATPSPEPPDCFLLEIYNPNAAPIDMTLTIRPRGTQPARAFQRVVPATPGFVRAEVPFGEIARQVDLSRPFEVEIVPNEPDDTVLYFGVMDFVRLRERPRPAAAPAAPAAAKAPAARSWKCVVWDLDNTLWDGTLIEDGPERIRIRPEVVAAIKELDGRGILNSIASKNNRDDAMAVLRAAGLDEYFLHPQISWAPKSQAVATIAKRLSIGIDTFAFVDDQPFEREEVRSALPQVVVIDAAEAGALVARPECQVPVTEESRQRRVMYREEAAREEILESYQGDYTTFLRECNIEVHITPLDVDNIERAYELAQRTNQMNFSGARYPKGRLQEIQASSHLDTHVIRCSDRFGSYGIVGFAVVDNQEPRLLDLMFSCRIQAKRVEHTVLAHLIRKFSGADRRDFFANYKKTDKNTAHGRVFEEMGFEVVDVREGVSTLVFRKDQPVPDERIVRIIEEPRVRS
jgi:FkbH-like protein